MRSRSLEFPAAASPLPLFGAPCDATVEGTIAQVFSTGCYVRVEDPADSAPAALLPILGPGALLLPTGLRCPGLDAATLAGLTAGEPVTVETDSAGVARRLSGFSITVTARRTWRPFRVNALAPAVGLAPGISDVVTEGPEHGPPGPRATVAVAARAGTPGLHARGLELVRTLEAGRGLASPVRDLLGYGPGSTPSGDDLLCGIALALRGLGAGAGTPTGGAKYRQRLAALRAHLPVQLLFERTSVFSASLVLSALDGYCLPQVAVALRNLAVGDVAAALSAVAPIGHSSGYDLLLGAALVPSPPPASVPPIGQLHAVPA